MTLKRQVILMKEEISAALLAQDELFIPLLEEIE
jgi:hypothetical protein